MHHDDSYSYYMTVIGTAEDQKQVYDLLAAKKGLYDECEIIGEKAILVPNGDAKTPYATYSVPDSQGTTAEWIESAMEQTLHDIAVQVPNAVIEIIGQNEDDTGYGFTKRFHGNLYQESKLVTTMPPLREGGDVPFEKRFELAVGQKKKAPVYILCEEYEDDDAIRSFTVLGVSTEREPLRQLMRAKIEKDPYGVIATNGINDDFADHFSTYFENGFVEYYILEDEVLSRDRVQQMLKSSEYDTTFHYAANFEECLFAAIEEYVAENTRSAAGVETNKVVETLLQDKVFQAAVKNSYWFNTTKIQEQHLRFAKRECFEYVVSKLRENANFFLEIGAISAKTMEKPSLTDIIDTAKEKRSHQQEPTEIVREGLSEPNRE